MKIGVFEPVPLNISLMGGGGVVLKEILNVLKKRGYIIYLFSPFMNRDNYENLSRLVDKIISIKFPTITSDFLNFSVTRIYNIFISLFQKIFDNSFDYTICNTYDNLIGGFDFGYVHFPARKYFKLRDIKTIKNIKDLMNFITSVKFKENTRIIAANSTFTMRLIKEKITKNVYLLYPPVNIINCDNIEQKDDIVVSLGRIARDKNYETVIKVAAKLTNIKFIIIGRIHDYRYYKELISRSPSNLIFLTNLDEKNKKEILCKAKIIFHAKIDEPFGISVVEGMSAGLIPVVHKSGGTWIDIVEEGKYGYGYLTEEEAIEAIKQALNDSDLRKDVKDKARSFESAMFDDRFLKISGL